MGALPDDVVTHLEDHLQVVARRQLIAMGYSNATVQGWLRRAHLTRLERGVLGLPGVPLSFDRKVYARVLRGPHDLTAGPFASLALLGVEKFTECHEIDVVAASEIPGIDRTKHAGVIPVLSATRALIEVAPFVPRKRLRAGFDDARRTGQLTIDHMRRRAEALGSEIFLKLINGGSLNPETEGERDLQAFLTEVFPDEDIEWGVEDLVPGRRLDAAIRRMLLGFEYDSRDFHVDREPDYIRDLECDAAGVQVIRLSYGMLHHYREETMRHLRLVVERFKGAPAHLTGG